MLYITNMWHIYETSYLSQNLGKYSGTAAKTFKTTYLKNIKNNITKQNSSEKDELNDAENTDELKKLKFNTQINMKHKYNSQVISKQILGH